MKFVLSLTPGRLKLILILLPFLLASGYYSQLAADRYVSEAIVTVREANQDQSAVPGIAMLLGGANPAARDDTLYLRQYILSLDLLRQLEAQQQLREHYASQKRDLLYMLPTDADQERFLDYYRSRVEVIFDESSGLLTLRVQGFEPAFAQALNQAVLEKCEDFVNAFSHRMARQQLAFGETELERASTRLQEAKSKVIAFQATNKLVDPQAQIQANVALTSELQATLVRQETELRNARSYLQEDSFQVRALRNQLESTRTQLESERVRATAGSGDQRLNALAVQYQDLLTQAAFAQDGYRVALATVENARIEAARKMKSLVVIEPPTLPQTAEYPRRIYNLVTLFVVTWLLYAIVRLVLATIREHVD